MGDVAALLAEIVGRKYLLTGDAISEDYTRDEALTATPKKPAFVAKPATAQEVADVLMVATEHGVPVTARGSGCGLSEAAQPVEGGLLISFERMNAVLEVDADNHVAVVQPGVTLAELDAKTAEAGLSYTVYPGELSSSVGGNVGTNAGGMRAVKYGVTRHNVLGLEAVLPTGEIIRTGGKMSKISSGYDLTQLIIGSEGSPGGIRRLVGAYCDAPIRHRDHATPHTRGGPTSGLNGLGECERCNYTKASPGWRVTTGDENGTHTAEFVTPSGAHYQSTAPPLPGVTVVVASDMETRIGIAIAELHAA